MSLRISTIRVGVEPAGGLVEDEDVRVVEHGLRQPCALPVAARQLADQLARHIVQATTAPLKA